MGEFSRAHPHVTRVKGILASLAQSPHLGGIENFEFSEPLRISQRQEMEREIEVFRDNVDSWIKQIRREFSDFSELPNMVNENTDNVQHNYELIYELKDQIDELKQEISALKLIQIISLKQKSAAKAQEQAQA
jgi:hypothetical protein